MSTKKNFPLRINPALYDILERWAADEFRSVNAHIEYLLRDAALKAGRLPKSVKNQAPVQQGEHDNE
jgi:hypothetical protein